LADEDEEVGERQIPVGVIGSLHLGDFPHSIQIYPGKRILDLMGSIFLLAITWPVLLLAALAVKLTSRGPVFYRGVRAGLGGRPFHQLKFRTMYCHGRGRAFTGRNDPRVTPVGKILRLTRIDELPQLINVLRGEMSLVGPRPEDYSVVQRCYSREQLRVLSVRPGLTGTVQVRSFPGLEFAIPEGEDPEAYYQRVILPERLKEDLDYVDRMSLGLDVWIILQTAWCVLVRVWPYLFRRRTW